MNECSRQHAEAPLLRTAEAAKCVEEGTQAVGKARRVGDPFGPVWSQISRLDPAPLLGALCAEEKSECSETLALPIIQATSISFGCLPWRSWHLGGSSRLSLSKKMCCPRRSHRPQHARRGIPPPQRGLSVQFHPAFQQVGVDAAEVDAVFEIAFVEVGEGGVLSDQPGGDGVAEDEAGSGAAVVGAGGGVLANAAAELAEGEADDAAERSPVASSSS